MHYPSLCVINQQLWQLKTLYVVDNGEMAKHSTMKTRRDSVCMHAKIIDLQAVCMQSVLGFNE